MMSIPAGHTGEQGLSDSVVRRHMAAFGTGLRRVLWRYDNDHAPAPHLLVFEHGAEHAPALVENRLVQPGFGSDVTARLFDGTLCRPRHIRHLQVFDHNDRVALANLSRALVQKIIAAVGNLLVNP